MSGLVIGDAPEPVDVNEFSPSQPLVLKTRDAKLTISRVETSPEGVPVRVPVAEIALPEGVRRALIILAPAASGEPLPLVGRVWDDSLEAHPAESVRVLNYSTRALALGLGDNTGTVAPGAQHLLAYQAGGTRHTPFYLAVQTEGEWTLIRRNLLSTPSGRRVLCLVRDGRVSAAYIDGLSGPAIVDTLVFTERLPR